MMKIFLTDSRSLTDAANTCFIAVTTQAGDGHRYIPELYERGVREFVVTRLPEGDYPGARFTLTDDSVAWLRECAERHRDTLRSTHVIGITGSVGKTTAKEWLYASLADRCGVARSPRSFNSQIGVPLSVLSVRGDDRVAIIEAGVSRHGEMAMLTPLVRPHTGLLTPVTDEHDDGFDCIDAKIDEKLSLFAGADDLIYPDDSRVVAALDRMGYAGRRHVYPVDDMAQAVELVARAAGLGTDGFEPRDVSTRIEIMDGFNDCRLLRDRFTPDIESLATALDFMQRQQTPSRTNTLILSRPAYDGVGRMTLAEVIAGRRVDRLILIGCDDMYDAADGDATMRVERHVSIDAFVNSVSTDDFDHELILTYGDPQVVNVIISMLERQQNETVLEVNLNAVIHNYNYFRSRVADRTGIICMLKADGYGSGSYQAARTLQSQGAAYIAVAVVDEGVQLRKEGITMPLIVLNPRAENTKTMFEYRLEPEVYSLDMLRDFGRRARLAGYRDFPIHLKFDTGMHRLGFGVDDIDDIAACLRAEGSLKVATVFSHLATADCPDKEDYTMAQLKLFDRMVEAVRETVGDPGIKAHVLNSTGILHYPAWQHELVRLGIGLYGGSTIPGDPLQTPLQPVSALTTPIINIKRYAAGETIGYGRRGVLDRDSIIATVPIGYADGLDRHLGCGAASMYVNGVMCPTVGNICMDICMIDVTDLGDGGCDVGDRAEVFGSHVPVDRIARTLGTISYEVLTSVSPRVKRVYYRE